MIWYSGFHLNCIITASITNIKKHDFVMVYKDIVSDTLSLELIHVNDKDTESVNNDFAFTYDIKNYIENNNINTISIQYQDLYKGRSYNYKNPIVHSTRNEENINSSILLLIFQPIYLFSRVAIYHI